MELQPYQPYFATHGKPVETPLQVSYESDVQFLGWQKTYPVSKGKESCFKGKIWLVEIVFHRRNSVFSPSKHRTKLICNTSSNGAQPYQPSFATYGKPVETSLQLSYQSDVQFLGWQKTYPLSKGKGSCFKGEIWLEEIVFHRRNSVYSPLKHRTKLICNTTSYGAATISTLFRYVR